MDRGGFKLNVDSKQAASLFPQLYYYTLWLLSTGNEAILGEALTKHKHFFQILIFNATTVEEEKWAVKRPEQKKRVESWQSSTPFTLKSVTMS